MSDGPTWVLGEPTDDDPAFGRVVAVLDGAYPALSDWMRKAGFAVSVLCQPGGERFAWCVPVAEYDRAVEWLDEHLPSARGSLRH